MTSNNSSKESEVCQYWLRGHCLYGDLCRYKHPISLFNTQNYAMFARKKKHDSSLPGKKKNWTKRRGSKLRDRIFRHWLLDNFGRKMLGQCSGIVDVAGGKGNLSFEFLNLNGIESTVIDPRKQLNLRKRIECLKKGYLHRNKVITEKYVDYTHDQCLENIKIPVHLKLFFDERLLNAFRSWHYFKHHKNVYNFIASDEIWQELIDSQMKHFKKMNNQSWLKKYNQRIDEQTMNGNNSNAMQNTLNIRERIEVDCCRMMELLDNCSCIIGLHPDYATEFIVDFALEFRKAFAIVPCCVFPNSFQNRKLPNGKKVRKYADFCEYLKLKNFNIEEDSLHCMDGQNRIIFWFPCCTDTYSACNLI